MLVTKHTNAVWCKYKDLLQFQMNITLYNKLFSRYLLHYKLHVIFIYFHNYARRRSCTLINLYIKIHFKQLIYVAVWIELNCVNWNFKKYYFNMITILKRLMCHKCINELQLNLPKFIKRQCLWFWLPSKIIKLT